MNSKVDLQSVQAGELLRSSNRLRFVNRACCSRHSCEHCDITCPTGYGKSSGCTGKLFGYDACDGEIANEIRYFRDFWGSEMERSPSKSTNSGCCIGVLVLGTRRGQGAKINFKVLRKDQISYSGAFGRPIGMRSQIRSWMKYSPNFSTLSISPAPVEAFQS